VEGAAR